MSAGADNAVRVWTPAAVRVFAGHQGPIHGVAAHPNGAQIVTASADKSIKVFDVNNGNVVRTLTGHTGAVEAVAVTKDGTKFVSGSDDKTVRVWNVADGKPLLTTRPRLPRRLWRVAASSRQQAGRRQGWPTGSIKVFDLTASRRRQGRAGELRESAERAIVALAFLPDPPTFSTGSADKVVTLWAGTSRARP